MTAVVQPQWDVGSSAFSLSGKIWGLMKAATVDDVQPASVYAIEAIGRLMTVDPHLIGRAVDALGGNKSYRIDTIKLHLGLSSGGIPSQIRLSTAATRTFILVTALRLHLSAKDIGNLLYEFLVESEVIEELPVSASQLTSLVGSLEGHSLALMEEESIPTKILGPMLDELALAESSTPSLFEPLVPTDASRILLNVFLAIRDDEIGHLQVSGSDSAIWLVSILSWICPHEVEVLNSQRRILIPSSQATPKVSVIIDEHSRAWKIEHWYSTSEPSSMIELKHDETYDRPYLPDYVPLRMAYVTLRHTEKSLTMHETNIIGTLAYAFVLAALDHGMLLRDDGEAGSTPSSAFREICSDRVKYDLEDTFNLMGWTSTLINRTFANAIAQCMFREHPTLSSTNGEEFVRYIDKTATNGGLLADTQNVREFLIVHFSLIIAEHVLLQATHQKMVESELPKMYYAYEDTKEYHFPITLPLLGIGSPLSATQFFNHSLSIHAETHSTRSDPTPALLATSSNGMVRYCRGLEKAPSTPSEAFEIISQPGQLKWRGANHPRLYEYWEPPHFSTAPKMRLYPLSGNDPSVPELPSLRIYNDQKIQFTIKTDHGGSGLYLRCAHPSSGDKLARLGKALVNWALAARVKPSNRNAKDELTQCLDYGITQLQLKAPGCDGLHATPDFPANTMAVASYSDNPMGDLLRFGTFDAMHLYCIIQGTASIYDCVSSAHERYGAGWIIMANP